MNIEFLTPAEEQLMLVLWNLGTFRNKDVIVNHPKPVPHPNTISTYLKILTKKGFLQTKKVERAFEYQVKISKETYTLRQVKALMQKYFDDSALEFSNFLYQNEFLSKEYFSPNEDTQEPLETEKTDSKKKKNKKNKKKKK